MGHFDHIHRILSVGGLINIKINYLVVLVLYDRLYHNLQRQNIVWLIINHENFSAMSLINKGQNSVIVSQLE
jgi:hypothetical protein